jgi:RNA-binding protein
MKKPISLTGKQKRHLRAIAHHLKPVVIIGSDRITPGLIKKVDTELTAHELIKIRITDGDREDLAEAEDVLCTKTRAAHVQSIGYTLVLYRPHPEQPTIRLPRRGSSRNG